MLAVCSVIKAMNGHVPVVATTSYVRDDHTANMQELAAMMDICIYYIDPGFDEIGHDGLARYCIGEVKEGSGAGGAMFMACAMGFSPDQIQKKIFDTIKGYS